MGNALARRALRKIYSVGVRNSSFAIKMKLLMRESAYARRDTKETVLDIAST